MNCELQDKIDLDKIRLTLVKKANKLNPLTPEAPETARA